MMPLLIILSVKEDSAEPPSNIGLHLIARRNTNASGGFFIPPKEKEEEKFIPF